jgi:hypothetical protein
VTRTARVVLAAALVGLGCSFAVTDDDEPLTAQWRSIDASPADHGLDVILSEHEDGRLTGSGSVRLAAASYAFALDSGLATSSQVRFRLTDGGAPFGRFDGMIVNRAEIVGRTTLDVLPDGRPYHDGFAVRLARVP